MYKIIFYLFRFQNIFNISREKREYILIFFTFIISLLFLYSCSIFSDNLIVKKNIKKIDAYKINLKEAIPNYMMHLQTKIFAPNGLLIKEIIFDSIGAHSWILVNPSTEPPPESNAQVIKKIKAIQSGMLYKVKERFNNKRFDTIGTKIYESNEYQYDHNFRIIRNSYCREDTFHLLRIWKYNSIGNLTEKYYKYNDSLLNLKELYFYDSSKCLVRKSSFRDDNMLKREEKYFYNNKGYRIKEVANVPSFKPYSVTTNSYDVVGNLIKKSTYQYEDSNYVWISYKYDEKKRKTEILDNYSFRNVFIYDKLGNLLDETCYFGGDDVVWKNIYVYNEFNTLMEKYEYEQDHSISVILYSYEYY